MRLYKSIIRFWALYFPISYNLKLNKKLTIKVCLLTFIIVVALFLPQPILQNALYDRGKQGKLYIFFVTFCVFRMLYQHFGNV